MCLNVESADEWTTFLVYFRCVLFVSTASELGRSLMRMVGGVLLLLSWLWFASTAGQSQESSGQCLARAPRPFSQTQRELLCQNAMDAYPAECAVAALSSTSIRNPRLLDRIRRLCEHADNIGPALCWQRLPQQMQTQTDEKAVDALVQLCREATSARPAECLLELKTKASSWFASVWTDDTRARITRFCRAFAGDVDALVSCLKQSARVLSREIPHRLELCRFATNAHVDAVTQCADQLQRSRLSPAILSHVCASTGLAFTGSSAQHPIQPQLCLQAASSQLKWLVNAQDSQIIMDLCDLSVSAAPVECALLLRSSHVASSYRTGRNALTMQTVAALCHQSRNASVVLACVNHLPSDAVASQRLIRLCAAVGSDDRQGSIAPAQCATKAKQLLSLPRASYSNVDSDLLVRLCEHATSLAPADCLAAVRNAHGLSAELKVILCQQAESDQPQLCFRTVRSHVEPAQAAVLCQRASSISPAVCINELQFGVSSAFTSAYGAQLCAGASSEAPATCFKAAPKSFSDAEKMHLCRQAESLEPANCAAQRVTRLLQPADQARLCQKALSTAPAICAMAAPFGMTSVEIITLCHAATNEMPAKCALAIPASLRVPWSSVAHVCASAVSTTPANCFTHRIRRREAVSSHMVEACRRAVAAPASLEVAHVSYQCAKLVPDCLLSISLHVLDQFNEEMPSFSGGLVRMGVDHAHVQEDLDPFASTVNEFVRGSMVASIVNGSIAFNNLAFLVAGDFTISFRSPIVAEPKLARIQIHGDAQADLLRRSCSALFLRLACHGTLPPRANDSNSTAFIQLLRLPHRHYLSALSCEPHWQEHTGGLRFQRSTSTDRIYAIHTASYYLLTCVFLSLGRRYQSQLTHPPTSLFAGRGTCRATP